MIFRNPKTEFFLFFFLLFPASDIICQSINFTALVEHASFQNKKAILPDTLNDKVPLSWDDSSNTLMTIYPEEWENGFYPGSLWYSFDLAKDTFWMEYAGKTLDNIETQKYSTSINDLALRFIVLSETLTD